MNSDLFGERMEEAVYNVAKTQHMDVEGVKAEIADLLDCSIRTVENMMNGAIPKKPEQVKKLLSYFWGKSRVGRDRQWAVDFLKHAGYPDPDRLLRISYSKDRRNIFICFDRSAETDLSLALTLAEQLNSWCNVFQDQPKSGDSNWTARVVEKLERAEFVVLLLSIDSVSSEVVRFELEHVGQLTRNHGFPKLLLVRIAYLGPAFTETFEDGLESERWIGWFSPDDSSNVVDAVARTIRGEIELPWDREQLHRLRAEHPDLLVTKQPAPSAQIVALESPEGGTMNPDSAFYIQRESDDLALAAIRRIGTTLVIKGPRQIGKSSLLLRIAAEASRAGKRVAYLDFQLLKSTMGETDAFYRNFCTHLIRQLNLDLPLSEFWDEQSTNSMNCSECISRILKMLEPQRSLVLLIDEAELVFGAPFQSEFFGMLRAWHNDRAWNAERKRLDLVLVTSTEPYIFIKDLNQSPFNVGELIPLQNFTIEQISKLNELHNQPLTTAEVQQLMDVLCGQPFLTRRAMYLVASQRMSFAELLRRSPDDDGPFGDHLRALLLRVANDEVLKQGLRQLLHGETFKDELLFFRLRGAGLVRREGKAVMFSCKLYAEFFARHLDD